MVDLIVLHLISSILLKTAIAQSCGNTLFEKISDTLHPSSTSGFLLNATTSRAECSSLCVRKTKCWSFYHNPSDDKCFLASRYQTVVPDTALPDISQNRFHLFRKSGGYSTCTELRQSHPGATDGDYWLYPTASLVHHNIVRLYCHNMASGQPEEYLSLPVTNSGFNPKEAQTKCRNDGYNCPGHDGVYNYTKIKVDPNTMEVTRTDMTFVTGSGYLRSYAWAGDCYSGFPCGPKGTFTVNTLGTGLMVDPSLQWETWGQMPQILISKSEGGAVISLKCGGYPGSCHPMTSMFLHLNPQDEHFLFTCHQDIGWKPVYSCGSIYCDMDHMKQDDETKHAVQPVIWISRNVSIYGT